MVPPVQHMRNTGGAEIVSPLLSRAMSAPTHYVLRVRGQAEATPWWASAIRTLSSAPPAARAVLSGRSRVELSAGEAHDVLAWARSIDGWDDGGITPLAIHPIGRPEDG